MSSDNIIIIFSTRSFEVNCHLPSLIYSIFWENPNISDHLSKNKFDQKKSTWNLIKLSNFDLWLGCKCYEANVSTLIKSVCGYNWKHVHNLCPTNVNSRDSKLWLGHELWTKHWLRNHNYDYQLQNIM